MEDTHFLLLPLGSHLFSATKCFFPDKLWNYRAVGKTGRNFNQELSKRLKENILPTVRETSYVGISSFRRKIDTKFKEDRAFK